MLPQEFLCLPLSMFTIFGVERKERIHVLAHTTKEYPQCHGTNSIECRLSSTGTTYDPALIRGRARLLAQKAEAYYGLGFIDESVTIAEEALTLARSIGANKTLARVRSLHTTVLESPWRKELSIARLGAVLSL